jgi:hypothetical protein
MGCRAIERKRYINYDHRIGQLPSFIPGYKADDDDDDDDNTNN